MICISDGVPKVTVTSAWVWPRVNNAEPCVRGRTLVREARGRMSVNPRPRYACARLGSACGLLHKGRLQEPVDRGFGLRIFITEHRWTFSLTSATLTSRADFSLMRTASLNPARLISSAAFLRSSTTARGAQVIWPVGEPFRQFVQFLADARVFLLRQGERLHAALLREFHSLLPPPSKARLCEPATMRSRSLVSSSGRLGLTTN